jgi:hypothetical protein
LSSFPSERKINAKKGGGKTAYWPTKHSQLSFPFVKNEKKKKKDGMVTHEDLSTPLQLFFSLQTHAWNLFSLFSLSLYEEEDTCMSYEEEDTCMSYEEEDTCMSYEEEDTCMSYVTKMLWIVPGTKNCSLDYTY